MPNPDEFREKIGSIHPLGRTEIRKIVDDHGGLDPRYPELERALQEGWLSEVAAGEGSDEESIGA